MAEWISITTAAQSVPSLPIHMLEDVVTHDTMSHAMPTVLARSLQLPQH